MPVILVGVAIAAVAGALFAVFAAGEEQLSSAPIEFSGLWLAIAFFACELFAIRVERSQGESYGFTLAMVPLAVGLVYAEPVPLCAARLLGVLPALVITRFRRPIEATYELAVHGAQTVFAILVFRLVLGDADPIGVRGVFALATGLFVAYITAGIVLCVVVT